MIVSKKSFHVYVGSPNCFDCQEFYPNFESQVQDYRIKIYYFNIRVKASRKGEMHEFIKSMGIKYIPAILEVNNGKVDTIYDGQSEDDMKRFYKKCEEKKYDNIHW